jgi:hypothetical protein
MLIFIFLATICCKVQISPRTHALENHHFQDLTQEGTSSNSSTVRSCSHSIEIVLGNILPEK